jgi:hypothetical protein
VGRCACGVILKGSAKRCKACAVNYLRQYSTDYFELQVKDEPIVLDFSEEEIRRWQEMSPRSLPKVPRTVRRWSETDYRRRSNRKMYAGIVLALVILGLVGWALVNG